MRRLRQHGIGLATSVALLGGIFGLRSAPAADTTPSTSPPNPASANHSHQGEPAPQSAMVDAVLDGLILIVDCSRTVTNSSKIRAQWAVSHVLDAAPDGIPMSLLLFGHNPAIPKDLVEVVGQLRAVPLTWRTKAAYRGSVQKAVPGADRVFLSGAVNVANDIVTSTDLSHVEIVIITDGQNAGDQLELAIERCFHTEQVAFIRIIGLGAPEQAPLQNLQHLLEAFPGGRLSLGFARTSEELTDSLRPIVGDLDLVRQAQHERQRALVLSLKETLNESNDDLQSTSQSLNQCRLDLTAANEARLGLQQSVQSLTSQAADLNLKFKERTGKDAETILQQTNLAATRKQEIDKLKNENGELVTQVNDLTAAGESAKKAVEERTNDARGLQAALDRCRAENQNLLLTAQSLKDQLCACAEAKKHVECDLALAAAEVNDLKRALELKDKDLLASQDKLASTERKLGECEGEKHQKDLQLVGLEHRVCCLEGDVKAAQATSLGDARTLAAAKKDAPNAIYNSPMQSEGGSGPGGVAGAAGASGPAGPAGGAAGGGAGGGGAAAGAPGGGGGDSGGGFGSILGAAAGIMAFL